jgi:sulfate adenylyltransferase
MSGMATEMRIGPAAPYGGSLVDILAPVSERAALIDEAGSLMSLQLSAASTAWLGMLSMGAISPLDRFMGQADYESSCRSLRLANGILFPMPVVLPVNDAAGLRESARIVLRDTRNHPLAIITIEEIFECRDITRSIVPSSSLAISGPMQVLSVPQPLLFPELRRTPGDMRKILAQMDCAQVVAADIWELSDTEQTGVIQRTAKALNAALLLNLPAEEERIDDFDLYMRLCDWSRNFNLSFDRPAILNYLNLPNTTRDVRSQILHAIIHKNYGAHGYIFDSMNIFPVSEDVQDTGLLPRDTLSDAMTEIGIQPIFLQGGSSLPKRRPDPKLQATKAAGLCIWFTGLPGAGKSTIAERLTLRIMGHGRMVSLLDGDVVRTNLSRGLSFSREDRDANVQRIGFVASEIVRHGGIVICAAVSPYRSTREQVRRMMARGAFVEVFVDTPVSICEQRDVKGFYAKARRGQMKSFTGVDDPYEPPENPEVRIATCETTPEEAERQIFDFLLRNFLHAGDAGN